jgi:hypothetical protein
MPDPRHGFAGAGLAPVDTLSNGLPGAVSTNLRLKNFTVRERQIVLLLRQIVLGEEGELCREMRDLTESARRRAPLGETRR